MEPRRWRSPRPPSARRLVHVSALGADENAPSLYARSKAKAEKLVLAALPAATILRPSVLFGAEDNFFNRFAGMARMSPVLPLIGGGGTRLQPVFAGDVAAAVLTAIEGQATPGATYELGGPEIRTFKELMQFVLATIERRRLLVPLPFALASLQAAFLQFLPTPPLTPDQVELLKGDNVVSDAAKQRAADTRSPRHQPRRHGGCGAVLSVAVSQDRPIQGPRRLNSAALEACLIDHRSGSGGPV